ncbi:MAG TPA: DUF1508 domain-containing protein [Bacteroides clarus]|nr:DUF1508 domain-containing protein [Bacteroides clarus]
MNHASEFFCRIKQRNGETIATSGMYLSRTCCFIKIPKANKPKIGPYV